MIEIRGVTKFFDEKKVLQEVDALFEKGKVNLIIGKSGSGKTVLLKSLIGLLPVDAGMIRFDDREITGLNMKNMKEIRKEMGVVFQGGALFDSLSVIENVLFPLNFFSRMNEEEKRERALFCLRRVNLNDTGHLYPAELSGGMKKRVAIARAIVLQPRYLFCDEPNSGLDPLTAIVIDNLLSELTHEYGMTTIINTHDMNSVFEIGEKIVFIHEGRKEWEGDREAILHSTTPALNEFLFTSKFNRMVKENIR
ncbi:MAG: ATP-binding cassette domain-containing protein [Odoribacteraceae bacterium]|jgi:phospholipid/cholesterol/gamma-HCH transport system ATP-binding protein|nr:ATP-binding cassette domain-containing protein [Odoribacteraceae bacterium]